MSILHLGVILLTGYFLSLFFQRIGFPKIMGATITHEFLGSLIPHAILKRAGETQEKKN